VYGARQPPQLDPKQVVSLGSSFTRERDNALRLRRRAIDVSASDTVDFKIETDNRVSVIFFRFADQRLNSRRAACRSLCAAYADRRCPALNSYHHPTLNSGRRALREVAQPI
jgi:hypothetical protein